MSAAAIEAVGLSKVYGGVRALDGMDLIVPEGSVFGFLGPNGAGKTTTLRILTGLARPTSGDASVFGHDVVRAPNTVRAMIGFLPDVPGYYRWMTGREFLRFSGQLYGLSGAGLKKRVEAGLDLAGLSGVSTKVDGYSRGMRQRLGVAQALISSPRLLMLDEPTSALDPMGRKDVLDMILALKGRTTVFFSTHILTDVERTCDIVAILDRGRVVRQSGIAELKAHGGVARVVVELEGDPSGFVTEMEGRPWVVSCEPDGRRIRMSVSDIGAARTPGGGHLSRARARAARGRRTHARGRLHRSRGRGFLMHGFRVFVAKEFREIARTWRIWVLPLIAIGFGALAPVMAKVTPALLESVAGTQPGMVFDLPDPTTVTAYRQWLSDLSQTVLLAVIISMAGMIATERKSGTAALVLTKPVSRGAFVYAKVVSNLALLAGSTLAGTLACWAVTAVLFENELVGELAQATAVWFAFAALFVTVMALLSVAVNSTAGAAGVGLVVYVVIAVLSQWGPARDNTAAGLLPAGDRLLTGESIELFWPIVTALIMGVICTRAAAALFGRKEL